MCTETRKPAAFNATFSKTGCAILSGLCFLGLCVWSVAYLASRDKLSGWQILCPVIAIISAIAIFLFLIFKIGEIQFRADERAALAAKPKDFGDTSA